MITKLQKSQFDKDGFAVLPNAIDPNTLTMLREECAYFLGYVDGSMHARNQETYGITHRGKRYFISNRFRHSRRMPGFLFGPLMVDIARAFLGDNAYLFVEQWVVKGPEQGMKFAWHQDGGYVKYSDPATTHAPYLTCWCALDDMSAENGTISVLPHARANTKNRVLDHTREEGSNDLVGYEGEDPGERVEVAAGSIVVFSSTTLHSSSANLSPHPRRAYLAQYSHEPIRHSNGKLWSMAVPLLEHGKVVGYQESVDSIQ